MRNSIVFLTALTALAACGGGAAEAACEGYLDAAISCVETAYAGDQTTLDATKAGLNGACDNVASSSTDYFDCLEEAYSSGDCATPEGYSAIASGLASCPAP